MGGGGGSRLPPISLLISSLLDLMLALVGTRCWCSVAEVLTRLLGLPVDPGKLEAGAIVWLCAICFGQACAPSPLSLRHNVLRVWLQAE